MQKVMTVIVLVLMISHANAQLWQYTSPNTTYFNYSGNKVGIGTTSPQFPLHVLGEIKSGVTNQVSFSTERDLGVVIQQGNIGGDYVSVNNYLSIFAHNIKFDGTNWIRRNQYSNTWATVMNHSYYDVQFALSNGSGPANTAVTPTTFMRISSTGSVGIGTTNISDANHKLFVETGIRTRKVTVDVASWPDYVFHPTYSLPALSSVADYIKTNHHLPEMPSADSVSRNGVDLGGNQAQLLKKIEELTLYVIQQQQQIDALKEEVKKCENR